MRKGVLYVAAALVLFAVVLCPARQADVSYTMTDAPAARIPSPAPTPPGKPRKLPFGSVGGALFISNLKSDIHLDCKSIVVEARQVGGSQKLLGKATAYGDIAKKSCRYGIGDVPANLPFQLIVLKPKELTSKCSQQSFDVDGTLPITLKSDEALRRNITIRNISCTVVK